MKIIFATLLMFVALSAHGQWIGGARPIQQDQSGTLTNDYPTHATPSASRSTSNCRAQQQRAEHDLKAAARQGDPRNYSLRLATLAPQYRVNCY